MPGTPQKRSSVLHIDVWIVWKSAQRKRNKAAHRRISSAMGHHCPLTSAASTEAHDPTRQKTSAHFRETSVVKIQLTTTSRVRCGVTPARVSRHAPRYQSECQSLSQQRHVQPECSSERGEQQSFLRPPGPSYTS